MLNVRPILIFSFLAVALVAPSAWAQDDAAAVEALRTMVTQSFEQMSAGNMDLAHTTSPVAVSWDYDAEGNPVAYRGADAWNASLDQMQQQMAATGMTMTSQITNLDCHAAGELGYCTIEWTVNASVGGQAMAPMMMRSTLISRKSGETWVPEHWHCSFAQWPADMGSEEEEEGEGEGP